MDSKRFLSRIAKLADKLADKLEKDKGFPQAENMRQFNALVGEYSKLLEVIQEKATDQAGQDIEEILMKGKKGAYEALLQD